MNRLVLALVVLSNQAFSQINTPLEGRWDLVISKDGLSLPSWLEVRASGRSSLVGRFVYAFGSARPIAEVKLTGSEFSFSIPPQWEEGTRWMEFVGTVEQEKLRGNMTYTDGKQYAFVGVRAPSLLRDKAPVWGKAVSLFNGKDLSGWHPGKSSDGSNQWMVANGILTNPKGGVNLFTDQSFSDFKLHVEFRYPKGSNSGIYLRGRYEVQINDGKNLQPWDIHYASVYGFIAPNRVAAREAGEWQTFDITLVGRTVTIVANGVTVVSEQVIPGITGGAIESREGEPGPIYLQGDHGPVEFRKIVITPAK